ncbi:MAG TPA: GDP-L-fucose synthase [Polyangiaceae bacterium]|nr:GDP-L-fucose synthase [Polyangiaceae bacterium]
MSRKVFVAGHRGLVGSALVRRLSRESDVEVLVRARAEVDLTDRRAVDELFAKERPDEVYLAAAKVGGILANDTLSGDFIRDNLLIQTHVIDAAHRFEATKLCFLGSSCIYPKLAPQPIREESLLTGPLEPTNDAYAVAKIAGIQMVRAYKKQFGMHAISVMPTNLYGPNDNFDLQKSHVLPALIRKFHEAKVSGAPTVTVWGTGTPRRELLHVDDLADACVFLMDRYDSPEPINVGVGDDVTIRELAELVRDVVGFGGDITFDRSKPDGTPRKVLDVGRIHALGWKASIPLREGIASTYRWFVEHATS